MEDSIEFQVVIRKICKGLLKFACNCSLIEDLIAMIYYKALFYKERQDNLVINKMISWIQSNFLKIFKDSKDYYQNQNICKPKQPHKEFLLENQTFLTIKKYKHIYLLIEETLVKAKWLLIH